MYLWLSIRRHGSSVNCQIRILKMGLKLKQLYYKSCMYLYFTKRILWDVSVSLQIEFSRNISYNKYSNRIYYRLNRPDLYPQCTHNSIRIVYKYNTTETLSYRYNCLTYNAITTTVHFYDYAVYRTCSLLCISRIS
jgi:hypothetical protein